MEKTPSEPPTSRSGKSVREAVRKAMWSRSSNTARLGAGLISLGITATGNAAAAALFPPTFELSSLQAANGGDGTAGFVLEGIDALDRSASAVSGTGDVNGDDIADLLIGARSAGSIDKPKRGETYVVFGRDRDNPFPANFELASLTFAGGNDGSIGVTINGNAAFDYSGQGLGAAGDINGDGIDDLLIGAARSAQMGLPMAGEAIAVFGRFAQHPFPAEFELSTIEAMHGGDGSLGFVMTGDSAHDFIGFTVSTAGDVNDDDVDDFIVGSGNNASYSYVVFGRGTGDAFPPAIDLAALGSKNGGDGSTGFVANLGGQVAAAGDINGDGVDDVLFGAPYSNRAHLIFGASSFSANEQADLTIIGQSPSLLGESVSGVGDVNGDGLDDIMIGAPDVWSGSVQVAGATYVIFGRPIGSEFPVELETSSLLSNGGGDGSVGIVFFGVDELDGSGAAVSGAGDINGDGVNDFMINAYQADAGGVESAGEVYVVFGRSEDNMFPAETQLSSLLEENGNDGSTGFVIHGIQPYDTAGHTLDGLGDINGDGLDDIVLGTFRADPDGNTTAGESYVIFGRAPDTDNDGVFDPVDNCPDHPNSDQADFDFDGIGDACDANNTPQFTSSPTVDATARVAYNYQVTTSDPDAGDSVAISLNTSATWLTLTPTGNGAGTLTGIPNDSDVGSSEVSLDATDGTDTSTQVFVVEVAPRPADTVAPVITLVGASTINLSVGGNFNDPGATAADDVDGDLTDEIVTTNNVNTTAAGTYSVMYDVRDSAGNTAETVSRAVIVSAASGGGSGGGGGGAITFLQVGGLFALLCWRRRSAKA